VKLKRRVILFFLLLSVLADVNAHEVLSFSRLPGFSQLTSLNVNCMEQDQNGYIWIGTRDGLNRFDGYSINAYRSFNGPSEVGLIGNQVDYLVVDHQNRIWVSTPYGISVYNPQKDYFEVVASELSPKDLHNVYLAFMELDEQGNLFVGVEETIYRFDNSLEVFVPIITSPFGDLTKMFIDKDGGWWLGHVEGGGVVYYADIKDTLNYTRYADQFELEESDFKVMDIESADGYIWIALEDSGLARLDATTGEIEILYSGTGDRFFFELYKDRNNHLWTCDYSGLKHYNSASGQFFAYKHNPFEINSISPNLSGVFQDKQGNFYTFHNGEGVHISSVRRGFQLYNSSDHHYWHVTNQNISAVHEDSKGHLWLGSFNGGIDVFNWDEGRIVHHPSRDSDVPESLGRGSVLALYRDSREQMWVGTHSGGLHLYNDSTGAYKSWRKSPDKNSISHNDLRSITEDAFGNLWLGLHGGGVDYFDTATERFTNYNVDNSGLSSDWVHDVLLDSKERLWVGTAYGLNRLNKETGRFEQYMAQPGVKGALLGYQIICFLEDSQQRLWLGTNNGLYTFIESTGTFLRHDLEADNHFVASIEEDQNGHIWFSTMGGLYRLETNSGNLFHFDEEDGLQGMGFNFRASYSNSQDIVLFAGSRGVNSFNPDDLAFNSEPPEVRFTRFRLFNEAILNYGEGSVLKSELNTLDKITLNYDQNFFSFDFVALNFVNPIKNQYACYMEGFDDDWIYLGNNQSASYTNLDPGLYTFRVKAANNDGVWNEEGISVNIRILPPWWLRKWFVVVMGLVFLFLVYAVFRIRTARLRKQKRILLSQVANQTARLRKSNIALKTRAEELDIVNRVLEERQRLITEQAEELESQAEHLKNSNQELVKHIKTKDKLFSIIAHDLRSPFNTIMGFSSLLTEVSEQDNKEQLKAYARYVNDASLLVFNLLENLLFWARSQTNEIQFVPEIFHLDEIIKENVGLVRETAIKKEIRINDAEYNNLKVFADVNMMRTVFRNLMINAVKFTDKGGMVSVTSREADGWVYVSVSDTGIGMTEIDLEKILNSGLGYSQKGTDGEQGSGLGLVLCQEFIARNNGRFDVCSQPGKGSTFCFSLPAQADL
jgi:signal transduction histidine kinase/ligand-binding sensor domain-containing protein